MRDARQLTADALDRVTAFDGARFKPPGASWTVDTRRWGRTGFLMVDINASSNLEDNGDNPMGTFAYVPSTMH